MSAWDGEERFSLLLLEEEEYYFRDYSCLYLKDVDIRYVLPSKRGTAESNHISIFICAINTSLQVILFPA